MLGTTNLLLLLLYLAFAFVFIAAPLVRGETKKKFKGERD